MGNRKIREMCDFFDVGLFTQGREALRYQRKWRFGDIGDGGEMNRRDRIERVFVM